MQENKVNAAYLEMVNLFIERIEKERNQYQRTDLDTFVEDFLTTGLKISENGQELYAEIYWYIDIKGYCRYHNLPLPTQSDFDNLLKYYRELGKLDSQ